MIDASSLRERLIASGIARPEDISGCNADEVARLEETYGRFPDSYRAILMLIGRRAGRLVDDREFRLYADQLDGVNRAAKETIATYAEDGIDLGIPDNAVFICSRYDDYLSYLLAGEAPDSPVWVLSGDTGAIVLAQPSLWDWIAEFCADAEHFITLGAAEQNARRGP